MLTGYEKQNRLLEPAVVAMKREARALMRGESVDPTAANNLFFELWNSSDDPYIRGSLGGMSIILRAVREVAWDRE